LPCAEASWIVTRPACAIRCGSSSSGTKSILFAVSTRRPSDHWGLPHKSQCFPLQEFLMTEEGGGTGRAAASEPRRGGRGFAVPPAWLEALEQRRPIAEWDAFLPDLMPETASLLAYLPPEALIVWDEESALAEKSGRRSSRCRDGGRARARRGAALSDPWRKRWVVLGGFLPRGPGVARNHAHLLPPAAARRRGRRGAGSTTAPGDPERRGRWISCPCRQLPGGPGPVAARRRARRPGGP